MSDKKNPTTVLVEGKIRSIDKPAVSTHARIATGGVAGIIVALIPIITIVAQNNSQIAKLDSSLQHCEKNRQSDVERHSEERKIDRDRISKLESALMKLPLIKEEK